MMIRAGHLNTDIMTAAQCSVNIVTDCNFRELHVTETICNGDYMAVPYRKEHSRRFDCDGAAIVDDN